LEDEEKERDMCELKRNVDPTYAVRPPMLNCSGSRNKEDATAGQSRQIGSLPQSHRRVLLQSSSDSPGRRGITLGRCLCSAAIHQKMKGQPRLLNPQTRSQTADVLRPLMGLLKDSDLAEQAMNPARDDAMIRSVGAISNCNE
jgi:hypothetical protein